MFAAVADLLLPFVAAFSCCRLLSLLAVAPGFCSWPLDLGVVAGCLVVAPDDSGPLCLADVSCCCTWLWPLHLAVAAGCCPWLLLAALSGCYTWLLHFVVAAGCCAWLLKQLAVVVAGRLANAAVAAAFVAIGGDVEGQLLSTCVGCWFKTSQILRVHGCRRWYSCTCLSISASNILFRCCLYIARGLVYVTTSIRGHAILILTNCLIV